MNVGKLSRISLQEIVTELQDKLQLNQWKSTNAVLDWFTALKYIKESIKKQIIKFIKFDIEAFYPSISKTLLDKSIHFAQSNRVFISDIYINIVKTARESFCSKTEPHTSKKE